MLSKCHHHPSIVDNNDHPDPPGSANNRKRKPISLCGSDDLTTTWPETEDATLFARVTSEEETVVHASWESSFIMGRQLSSATSSSSSLTGSDMSQSSSLRPDSPKNGNATPISGQHRVEAFVSLYSSFSSSQPASSDSGSSSNTEDDDENEPNENDSSDDDDDGIGHNADGHPSNKARRTMAGTLTTCVSSSSGGTKTKKLQTMEICFSPTTLDSFPPDCPPAPHKSRGLRWWWWWLPLVPLLAFASLKDYLAVSHLFAVSSDRVIRHPTNAESGFMTTNNVVVDEKGNPIAESFSRNGFVPTNENHNKKEKRKTLCIKGGGFPGFFFTLGQLQSLKKPGINSDLASYDFHCYSAGCLCVVIFLADLPFDEVMNLAVNAQHKWKQGEISRFEMVPLFVEQLIEKVVRAEQRKATAATEASLAETIVIDPDTITTMTNNNSNSSHSMAQSEHLWTTTNTTTPSTPISYTMLWWLHNVRILTGVRDDRPRSSINLFSAALRSPAGGDTANLEMHLQGSNNNDHHNNRSSSSSRRQVYPEYVVDWLDALKTMLIQTTWIPGVTGNDWFLENHIDGGFVFGQVQHECDRILEAAWTWELLWNIFNTDLSRDQALHFWNLGLRDGQNQ